MALFGTALAFGTIGLVAGLMGAVIAAYATRSETSALTSYVQRPCHDSNNTGSATRLFIERCLPQGYFSC